MNAEELEEAFELIPRNGELVLFSVAPLDIAR
jgi:hypothetical protein